MHTVHKLNILFISKAFQIQSYIQRFSWTEFNADWITPCTTKIEDGCFVPAGTTCFISSLTHTSFIQLPIFFVWVGEAVAFFGQTTTIFSLLKFVLFSFSIHSHLWVCPFLSYPYPYPPICSQNMGWCWGLATPVSLPHTDRVFAVTFSSLPPPPKQLPPECSAPFVVSIPHVYIKHQLVSETLAEVSAVDLPPALFQLSHEHIVPVISDLILTPSFRTPHRPRPSLALFDFLNPFTVTSGVWVTIRLLPTAFRLFWYL